MLDLPSAQQIEEFRQAFDIIDRGGDGLVDVEDLAAVMRAIGGAPSHAELQDMIGEVDADGKGKIDFTEFLALMSRQMRQSDIEDELRQTFRAFHREPDGAITAQELRRLLAALGLDASAQAVRAMIAEADRDRDGRISFEEFRALALGK
jgi:calmodulin